MEQMSPSKPDTDPEAFIKNVGEFHYEPSVGEIPTTRKNDHDLYLAYLLPLSPKNFTYEETIEKCGKVFGDNASPFNRRFKCPNLAMRESEDIHKYAAIVNRMCNAFSYGLLKEDQLSFHILINTNFTLPDITFIDHTI
ncbi:unnamed protein product [Hymenolepis diminuta]|uniref:Uncharacterized protein n=1 Tax=Hymenolepis diminuta TaxID=6216 RepID=A0A564YRC5_HYMDI|nr:unnamed protein product [Hymenolepis diminuta]